MKPRKKLSLFFYTAIVALLASIFPGSATCRAYFSDLASGNRYYTAVGFLASAGIINGYPDGTFRADQTINRAEFLKLLLESADIIPDITVSSGFSDVDESAWYAKYVRKSLNEGWIQGYPDGTFRPEDAITKAEGLKIIGKVQDWKPADKITDAPFLDTPADQWFTPYVDYAKSRNFLEDSGRFFIPETNLTRGSTAEVLFRSYVTALSGADTYSSSLAAGLPDTEIRGAAPENPASTPPPALDFVPVDYETVPADYFNNVTLKESFPNTFYLDEIYYFEGTVGSGNYDKAFVFLAPEGMDDTAGFINNVGTVYGNSMRIPVVFRRPGNYRLGLILGSSGESSVTDISVLPSLPPSGSSVKNGSPSNLEIAYEDHETALTWDQPANSLTRLDVFQGTRTKTYFSRQGINRINLLYRDFEGFSEGPAYAKVQTASISSGKPLAISGDWSASGTMEFHAVGHHFSEYVTEKISVNTLPDGYSDGSTIRFSGTAKTGILADAAVTKPDGSVEMIRLGTSGQQIFYYGSPAIDASDDFFFTYKATLPGTYFVEINSLEGEAVLNHPLYREGSTPLLPDFVDLSGYEQKETYFNLADFRTQLLNLINNERRNAGITTVSAEPALNNLAQLHSDDMVARAFFGHINPDGETPNDRRIRLRIPTTVGENLAQAPSVLYTHYGLMRSGIHRKNILDPAWTKVGIGLTRDKNGQLFTTEEFSGDPLTEFDLMEIENEMLDRINSSRRSLDISPLAEDTVLAEIGDSWSSRMADLGFFDFVAPDGETLYDAVRAGVNDRSVQAIILETSSRQKLIDEAMSGSDSTSKTWQKIGIGVKADDIGTLKATLLYTTY